MTTLVKGPIKLVTDRPDTVRKINLRAPELRLHGAGIVTDHNDDIPVVDGQVEFEALPGPAVLTLVTAGGAPLRSVDIVVPDEDTATLAECLDHIYVYEPPAVGRAQYFAREAGEHADRAEAGAARVGSAEQVGQWVGEAEVLRDDTVAAADAAEGASTSAAKDADRAETARQGAETIEQNLPTKVGQEVGSQLPGALTKQLPAELDNRVPPKVAEAIAADRAVADAAAAAVEEHAIPVIEGEVGNLRWHRGIVPSGTTSLDDLEDGVWGIANGGTALALGIPGNALGNLQIQTIVSGRTAWYLTNESSLLITASTADGWAPWAQVGEDIGSGSGDGERTVNVGNPDDQYKTLYLDVNGKLRVDTSRVTAEWDVTSKGYVDKSAWGQGLIFDTDASLDELIDGVHSVANSNVASALGIPGNAFGTLQMMTIANGRTAFYLAGGANPILYINARSGGVWSGWKEVSGGDTPVVEGEKWHKGLVYPDSADLDLLDDGMWGIASGTVSRTLGIPGNALGNLQIQTIGQGRTALIITQSETPVVYVAAKSGGVWSEWQKIFPTDISPGAQYSSGGLKTVPLAVSTGVSGDGATSGHWRSLVHFGAPITRWRLHISNISPVWGSSRGGFTLGEVSVGTHDGGGQMTALRTLNPTSVEIADGDEWVSDWVTGVDLTEEHLIDWAFDGASSTYLSLTSGWDMSTGTPTLVDRMALWLWIEAETYEQTPVVALIGDSTGAGVGATRPVYEAPLSMVGRERGFLPVLYAHSGDTLAGNPGIEDFNFSRWKDFAAPDSIIIQAGSNDLHAAGADLAEMQRRYKATASAAHQIAPVVIGATVKPRYPNHPDYDVNRVAFNEWLQTQPEGIRDVLQFDEVLAPDGSLPDGISADGAHLNTVGYEIMARAFDTVPVSRPPVAMPTAEVEELDTGWRIIPLLAGEGTCRIRRVGKHVTVVIEDWILEGEYAVHVADLPSGYRAAGKQYFIAADRLWGSPASIFGMYWGSNVSWLRSIDGSSVHPSTPQSGEITFLTDDPEPVIYPGTPA